MNRRMSYKEAYAMHKKAGVVSQFAGSGLHSAIPTAALTAGSPEAFLTLAGIQGVGNLAAAITALATRTRTAQEQRKASMSPGHAVANLLVPGWANYNMYKRIGQSWKEDREYKKQKKLEKEKEEQKTDLEKK